MTSLSKKKSLRNRLDDIDHDIHHHDFSDRPILKKIEREPEIQPLLAKKISDAARGQYTVSREEEVADNKEPDIRITSIMGDRCIIEIKIGDNWSVTQLEDALKTQLVGQYLRHSTCTAGCLLITYAGPKKFKDPNTGKLMEFEHVIERLKRYATSLENAEKGRIKLAVFPLDLRNKILNKRTAN